MPRATFISNITVNAIDFNRLSALSARRVDRVAGTLTRFFVQKRP
jgi:hypothetical protein